VDTRCFAIWSINVGLDAILTCRVVYEEQSDGFVFSRKPSKRATTAEVGASETNAPEPGRRKKRSLSPLREDDQPKRRRSARLSGDKEKEGTTARSASSASTAENSKPAIVRSKRALDAPELAPPNRDLSPPVNQIEAPLHAEKQRKNRDAITKIALPFADTPVIKRNKAMREKGKRTSSGTSSRRSSSGIRGRRASSLIESGQSNGMLTIITRQVRES
jgi:kinetochore protein Mis13/DSN1